ncbi:MAG TPA: MoxR family ATPase [Candidatus Competibacteraceae bacterium]|nr:MoxR family ATPase [Candidatus Competibacteraceae bacterium]MCP5132280.1 MoxR family ATPase [Gammaproteobacteria bacterium]HPF59883.1 MoxR family ATPase [Candidatus Competibacteraceae bacterium]HRY18088.1 MoxR family ATPase [Candidatus Competibacteraceae bacterium]
MSETSPAAAVNPLSSTELQWAGDFLQTLRGEISQVLVGQQAVVDQVLIALSAAGHVLIEGVPGLGKTLLVRALAACVNARFARIQFTADLMPSDVTGHALYNLREERFEIRRGPVFCHFLLADEINRAPAKTQAALLEVMQEGQVTIEGQSFPLPPPFMTLATQNPIEHEGTYPLPEAQLDRFLLKIQIGYPNVEEETALLQLVTGGQVGDKLDVSRVRTMADPGAVLNLQRIAARLNLDNTVLDYAVRLVAATRKTPGFVIGAGPRGGIALIRAARAHALLNHRDFVTPDDVKSIAKPALRHRLTLAAEYEMEGAQVDEVLDDLLRRVAAPRG